MDLNAVALGLAANVTAQTELNALDHTADAVPDPAFMVGEIDVTFDATFGRGADTLDITARVLVARTDDEHGQIKLREFMSGGGVNSVKKAIESDRTLGGAVHDLRVVQARGNRLFQVGEKLYYGVEFGIFAVGSGS